MSIICSVLTRIALRTGRATGILLESKNRKDVFFKLINRQIYAFIVYLMLNNFLNEGKLSGKTATLLH